MLVLRVLIFVLAAGAAGAAAWLSTRNEPQIVTETVAVAETVATTDVLVAVADIASGSVLSPENVRWEPWPQQNLNENFITRDDRPTAVDELSGNFVTTPFVAGEPIREARLMAANMNLLSNKLTPGKRAVAVKVTAESTAGGFILPGDRVDVIRTSTVGGGAGEPVRNQSQIIISNVRVLAIDQTAAQAAEGIVVGKTATLELTPNESEQIIAAEASGMLSLALRAVTDHFQPETAQFEPSRTVRIHRATQTSVVSLR